MTQEIKFTSFGIPYIFEFENVSVVPHPEPRHSSSSSSSSSSFCYIDTPPPSPRFPSFPSWSPSKQKHTQHPHSTSKTLSEHGVTKPLPPPPPQSDNAESHGICIQFPPECNHAQLSRKERLAHLQEIISVAVLDAGMSRSPGNATPLEKHSIENAVHGSRRYKTPDALFCGTYGQMMTALEGAGLSVAPCAGVDLSGYTRLGALFVARNDGASGVQLRRITLWG